MDRDLVDAARMGDREAYADSGMEPAEIAQTLGIPAGTVRSRLHHAHRAMRAALEADARSTAIGGMSA